MKQDMIVILDLGSTENTVLARQIRDLGVYSEIHPHDITVAELNKLDNVKGVILNGGENRIVDGVAVEVLDEIFLFKTLEYDDLVDAGKELRSEEFSESLHDTLTSGAFLRFTEAKRIFTVRRTGVRSHHNDGVGKINGSAVSVGQLAFVKYL